MGETKECPSCAEIIKIKARKCRYCGHVFSDEEIKQSIEEAERLTEAEAKKTYDVVNVSPLPSGTYYEYEHHSELDSLLLEYLYAKNLQSVWDIRTWFAETKGAAILRNVSKQEAESYASKFKSLLEVKVVESGTKDVVFLTEEMIENMRKKQEKKQAERLAEHEREKALKAQEKSCYVATSVYGDQCHGDVVTLRAFRDDYLSKTNLGRRFISWYYTNGSLLANRIAGNEIVKMAVKYVILIPLVFLVRKHLKHSDHL